MEDSACPKCKTTVYRNPNMKMMVNVCGHNLCDSCVELLFARGSGACPECGVPLRRTNFRVKLFEDASVDKEIEIRKRVLRDFNKREEDFSSLREYNDYLEMVEDIIFNLANDLEVQETNKKIAEYKEANKDFITANRHRTSKEAQELVDIMAEEDMKSGQRQREIKAEEDLIKKLKAETKEKLLDDLMFSNADAAAIVSQHAKIAAEKKQNSVFSTGLQLGAGIGGPSAQADKENAMEISSIVYIEPKLYVYQPPVIDFLGPTPPDERDIDLSGYSAHVRPAGEHETPAGYSARIPTFRAMQDAFSGLFFAHA